MEIKIECACGEKYKFDVDPAYHRMPSPVNCPTCGADGTAQADEILLQSRTDAPPAVAPPTHIAPPPPGIVAAPSPAAGLRISHADTPPPPSAPPPVFVPPAARRIVQSAAAPKKNSNAVLITVVVLLVVFGLIGAGVWVLGRRAYQKFAAIAEEVKTMSASADTAGASDEKYNFTADDSVILYVQHTNHAVVAGACQEFWRDKLHKKLAVTSMPLDEGIGSHEYEVMPSYNGWVRIMGNLEWPAVQYEGLAQHLSQKFGGLAFETSDVDFSGAYHFGAYEAGARKFHAQMDIVMKVGEPNEVVTTEGNDWAIAHGFKPGPEGFKEFSLRDGDKIAQALGMKLWDEPEDAPAKSLLLKEPGAK